MQITNKSFDNFILRANPRKHTRTERLVRGFCEIAHNDLAFLQSVINELDRRMAQTKAASVREVWDHLCFAGSKRLNYDHDIAAVAARAVLFVRPDLNGFVEVRPSELDDVFGCYVADEKLPGHYARVVWEARPAQSTPPAQAGLFEVAG